MIDSDNSRPMTRDEELLLGYYRSLPAQEQMDILSAAEACCNAQERMNRLVSQKEERAAGEEPFEPWRH